MNKRVKILLLGLVISVIVIVVGFAIFGEDEIRGEKYSTSTQGLEVAKASEIINLKDGDRFDLSIDIIQKEIAGKTIRMFGYNGQIPGPMLKVDQNSQVFISVTNNLDVETTVHWHGLRLENEFDGNPEVTMDPQLPGEKFEYKLDFVDEGIYWYHPHVREDFQQEMGLYGNILVDSQYDDYYNRVNKEIPIILDDILIEDDKIYPFYKEFGIFGMGGRWGNIMLINGDDNYNLDVTTGEVIRFYITNVANTRLFDFSIPNAKIKLIGSDIGSYEKEEFVNSVVISSSERYTVEVLFDKPGEYEFKSITPDGEYTLGKIKVSGNPVTFENDFSNDFNSLRENKYVIEDIDNFRQYFDKEVDINIKLSQDIHGLLKIFGSGDKDKTDNDWSKVENGYPDKLEWEDPQARFNKDVKSSSITWILKDINTG